MNYIYYFTLSAIILSSYSYGQCPQGNISISSQAQISSFSQNYPGCTHITGTLEIEGINVTSLSGLSNVASVSGDLKIKETGITNLIGLENLKTIGGQLSIKENNLLSALNGIQGLISVKKVEIEENPLLTNISAFGNASTTIQQKIKIKENAMLGSCAAPAVCEIIGRIPSEVSLSMNSPGCNSLQQVIAACSELSISEYGISRDFTIQENAIKEILKISNPKKKTGKISITGISGKVVLQHNISTSDIYIKINISHLERGLYFVKIFTDNGHQTVKIIKQ